MDDAEVQRGPEGGYGVEGSIIRALAPLPTFSGLRPVIGSWIVGTDPVAMSIAITRDTARFVPHVIA